MKTEPRHPSDHISAPDNRHPARSEARRRQAWTILFAIILASIAGISSAQSPASHCDGCGPPLHSHPTIASTNESIVTESRVHAQAIPVSGGAIPQQRLRGNAKPAYVELVSSLANFDADADPDGWRAEVVLRDRKDRPVVMRATAVFELMPRVATADHHRMVNARTQSIRWSVPLEFDQDGVARVKLPLRQSLKPLLGWTSAIYPPSGTRSRPNVRYSNSRYSNRTFVTSDLRNLIGTPSTGEMRVKVSVPTEGVFEAASPVYIRPSVLVDTQWPYR